MVSEEGECTRYTHGDVAEYSHHLVDVDIGVSSKVGEVMNTAVESMVEQPSNEVGVQKQEPGGQILDDGWVTFAR